MILQVYDLTSHHASLRLSFLWLQMKRQTQGPWESAAVLKANAFSALLALPLLSDLLLFWLPLPSARSCFEKVVLCIAKISPSTLKAFYVLREISLYI